MNHILPIGTIVRVKDNRFLIIGYDFGMVDGTFEIVYKMLLYPIGFVGGDSCVKVANTEEMEIVHKPEALDNHYAEYLEYFQKDINEIGVEQAAESIKEFYAQLAAEKEVDQ